MKMHPAMALPFLLAGSAMGQTLILSAEQIAVAGQVHVGTLPCELGQTVVLLAEPGGYFGLRIGKLRYRLTPQLTTTGAVRLEDKTAGIVWLQLANKSMLMNHKLGRRMADECKSVAQAQTADHMRRNPPASVLEVVKPAITEVVKPAVAEVVKPVVTEVVKSQVGVNDLPGLPIQ